MYFSIIVWDVDLSINHPELDFSWIHINQNFPLSRDRHILTIGWESFFRPLGYIRPQPEEIFSFIVVAVIWAFISAVDRIDIQIFKLLEHTSRADTQSHRAVIVIVRIVTKLAGLWIEGCINCLIDGVALEYVVDKMAYLE